MKQYFSFTWLMALVGIAAFNPESANAQHPERGQEAQFVIHVDNLTAQDRDALQQQLSRRADLRLEFSCVPAGILVFAGQQGEAKAITRQRASTLLTARFSASRITELSHSMADAEAACAQLRN